MSTRPDRGWALHAAAGGVVGLLFALGYGREVAQHVWSLTAHQWLEALAWPAGGLVAIALGLGVIALVKWARRGDE